MNAPVRKIADTRPKYLYPVLAREGWGVKAIAWFADYYKAVDMVNANVGKRFMYIGEPEEVL